MTNLFENNFLKEINKFCTVFGLDCSNYNAATIATWLNISTMELLTQPRSAIEKVLSYLLEEEYGENTLTIEENAIKVEFLTPQPMELFTDEMLMYLS